MPEINLEDIATILIVISHQYTLNAAESQKPPPKCNMVFITSNPGKLYEPLMQYDTLVHRQAFSTTDVFSSGLCDVAFGMPRSG